MTITVSVSDLDSFRRYRDHEELSLADLMKRLRREEPPTDKMRAGTALHRVLETAQNGILSVATADGHRFVFILNDEITLAPIREMRGNHDYIVTLPNGSTVVVNVRARVDSIAGTKIEDHKLSSQFDAERYHDAFQWRLYLSIFGGEQFTYNMFIGKSTGEVIDGAAEWEVTEFHRITFYRYPEMEADILRELALYAEFAIQHLESEAA